MFGSMLDVMLQDIKSETPKLSAVISIQSIKDLDCKFDVVSELECTGDKGEIESFESDEIFRVSINDFCLVCGCGLGCDWGPG